MSNDIEFEVRDVKEYKSTLGPKLFLIAEKPLDYDKNEIFDSPIGMKYLSICFKSKFKSVETHVSYIDNNKNIPFLRKTFFDILEAYNERGTLEIDKLIIAFVGKIALEKFVNEIKTTLEDPTRTIWYVTENNTLRIYDRKIAKEYFYLQVVILPNVEDDLDNIPELLNNTNIAKHVISPYCTTQEIINKINVILMLYKDGYLNGFKYDFKFYNDEQGKLKTEYFSIYDAYTGLKLHYSTTDEIVKNDNVELITEFKTKILELFTTVPVYTENFDTLQASFGKKYKLTYIDENACMKIDNVRASFVFRGDENNPNGPKSEWYDKWYKEAFKPIIKENYKKARKTDQIARDGYDIPERYEWIYDIEVFKYDWLFVAKTLDKKNTVICWNDPDSLREWIRNKILIGFNNAQYDDSVIRHAMALPYAEDGTMTVKEYSDALVEGEKVKRYPPFKEKWIIKKREGGFNYNIFGDQIDDVTPPNFISWDISFHLPFDIRRNSLKKLTMSVLNRRNYDSEVPFDIQTPLTPEQRLEVEKYCEMDVDNTMDLFLPDPEDIEKKKADPKYKMRTFARDSYDIKWNLIIEFKMKALNLITKSASFAGKVLCGEDAKPCLKNTVKAEPDGRLVYYSIPELAMKELAGHPVLEFYLKNQQNPNYIHEKFEYYMGGDDESHLYQFGFGGLHQALINYTGHNLCNFDVASLYPSLVIRYGLMSRGASAHPDSYEQVYNTRIAAKHDGRDLLNQGLKLVLNGAIGAFLSDFNPLYDTWSNSTVCVYGQLLLFILCKRLFDAGFVIVQTNTDGIMVEKRDDIDFMTICKQWEQETKLVLEYDDIVTVRQLNVNNYTTAWSNGKVKSKGVFASNEKMGLACAKILCNIAFDKPLLEGCLPRDFVIFKRHGIGEIYDGITNQKLEGRSLAFVIGYANDPRTQMYYSRSKNEREVVAKDEKGKPILDENGNQITEIVHSISKISGFTDHMLLVDDVNEVKMEDVNTNMYIAMAKNLLGKVGTFGPYYDEGFIKTEEPAYLQALNPLKDAADEYPTKSGVICQNFLFECDYMSKEEQEEMIKNIEQYTYRIVWSGSKSYHIVVRLNKPVSSVSYKKIWYYLQYKLGITGADEQSALPSKYTRVPDQINIKTGNMQTLYSENKYEFDLDELLENMPKLKDEVQTKPLSNYKGQISIRALERHIKRQDWSDGNRFAACQKLSPILIAQVTLEELIKMIPVRLEKDHINVLRSKLYYFEKYKQELTANHLGESIEE